MQSTETKGDQSSHLIHITGCPTLSNGEVDRDILSLKISPAPGGIFLGPVVVQTIVEGGMVAYVSIVACCHALNCIVGTPTLISKVPRE